MAVAPRPWQTPQLPAQPRKRKFVRRASQSSVVTALPPKPKTVSFRKKNVATPAPRTKVKLFAMGQRFTQFLAIASITTAVGLYASNVYNQKVWGDAYAKLDRLRDDERSIVTNNESIKQQLIEQSEQPEVSLVTPKPDQNIYVPAPKSVKLRPQAEPSLRPLDNQAPIGY